MSKVESQKSKTIAKSTIKKNHKPKFQNKKKSKVQMLKIFDFRFLTLDFRLSLLFVADGYDGA